MALLIEHPTPGAPDETPTELLQLAGGPTTTPRGSDGSDDSDGPRPTRRERLRAILPDALWLAPLLAIGGVVNGIGLFRVPQFIDDEGTYTAQAYAVERLGELTHYTYWYDHPPLGWLQMAGWTNLTGAFDRYPSAVMAGRETMMVALLAATVLLWTLVRRIGAPRIVAAVAVLLFTVSPLAVQFHRTVYLDNIAVVWILLAFVLATARHRQLGAFVAAAVAAGIAVLTKETFLLMVPFVFWVMVRGAAPTTRRYTLTAAGAVLTLTGIGYLLFALLKGELVPGMNRVSLWDGIAFQLLDRDPSGSLTDADSLVRATTDVWVDLDPVFLVTGGLTMVVGLFLRRTRPYAAALALLVLMVVRPGGYVPVPHMIGMLPLMALLVPVVVWTALRTARRVRAPGTRAARTRSAAVLVPTAALAAAGLALAVPQWSSQLRGQLIPDFNQPFAQAQEWVEQNVPTDYRLLVDDVMWVDLVEAGFPRENVVWYYKADTDPAVIAQSPNGWQDSDYVITTDSMRTFPSEFPRVRQAIDNSTLVASFGEGDRAVEVRRVRAEGIDAASANDGAASERRALLGPQLSTNPNVVLDGVAPGDSGSADDAVSSGRLDDRLAVALAQLGAAGPITVELPAVVGEEDGVLRTALITQRDGAALTTDAEIELADWFTNQNPGFAPQSVTTTDEGLLVTYSLTTP
ncbi:glycosyltransferase [Serinibacter arcticus]|uniref:Glycosyltransferase n=1 Tax=Serinibacter arcticus TaxID=1655435 RepID=A0A2U1ZU51_9MICO|nr:glycosyltransferase family 39 protein [Serinibacter arcticus]PWD50509.1 glycosyltransferase [Serinibacter arcticus]